MRVKRAPWFLRGELRKYWHEEYTNAILTNILALYSRNGEIFFPALASFACDSNFKQTFFLSHPVDGPERETPRTRGGFRCSMFTGKARAEDESTKSHAGTSGTPVAVFYRAAMMGSSGELVV